MTDVTASRAEYHAKPASAAEGGKYVYCIVRSDRQRDFGAIGIGGGQKVFTVAFRTSPPS